MEEFNEAWFLRTLADKSVFLLESLVWILANNKKNYNCCFKKMKDCRQAPQGQAETVTDNIFYNPAEESLVKVPSGAGAEISSRTRTS